MNRKSSNIGKVVLITGASRGIGLACAELLSRTGMKVYGTTRSINTRNVTDCDSNGFVKLTLDVRDDRSVSETVSHIIGKEGRIDILINNAGFGIAGSIEDTDLPEAKSQFETNFFGIHRMVRAVLPFMRQRQCGRIINIGSIMGLLTIPFQGFYAASKYALEAFTEALRMEVASFGINVSIVEPGDTRTGFTQHRKMVVSGAGVESVYSGRCRAVVDKIAKDETHGVAPEKVAKVVARLISMKHPPLRSIVGVNYRCLALAKRFLPAKRAEWCIKQLYDPHRNMNG